MIPAGRALLCLGLLSGCAHGPARGPSRGPVPPAVAVAPARPSPAHGLRPFPFRLRDGRTGAPLPSGSLTSRMEAARVVYAGEHHTDAASHDVQLALLGRLYGLDRSVAVGLEMLPREAQPQL